MQAARVGLAALSLASLRSLGLQLQTQAPRRKSSRTAIPPCSLLQQIAHTDSTFSRVGACLPFFSSTTSLFHNSDHLRLGPSAKELQQPTEEPSRAPGDPERMSCNVGF